MKWKVYDGPQIGPIFSGIVCMISASDRLIAVITEDETPVDPSTWGDVARLIAAAPDLLAAAQSLIEAHGDTKGIDFAGWCAILSDRVEDLKAAVAKAESSHA